MLRRPTRRSRGGPNVVMLAVGALVALPLLTAAVVWAVREPLRVLLPFYAATVPFGSGLAVPGLPDSVFSASSLAGFLLIGVLGCRLVVDRPGPRSVPFAVACWLLFVAVTGLTAYWTVSLGLTVEAYVVTCTLVALYVVVRLSEPDVVTLRRLETGILLGGALAASYGLYQYFTGGLLASEAGGQRFGRDLTDPNHLAATLLLPLTLALARAGHASTALRRVSALALGVGIVVAIMLTGSRGGVLGVLAVIVILAGAGARPARTLAAGAAVIGALALLVVAVPGVVPERLTRDDSSGRTGIWQVGLNACDEYCLVGAGWGAFGLVYEQYLAQTPGAGNLRDRGLGPHNIFIGAAVEAGAAGLVLLVVALGAVVREAAVLPRAVRGPPLAALCGLLFTAMLLGNLRFKYFWLVLLYVGVVHQVVSAQRAAADDVGLPSPVAT